MEGPTEALTEAAMVAPADGPSVVQAEPDVGPSASFKVSDYDYSSFYYSSSDDPFAILGPYNAWFEGALPQGYYLFSQAMSTPPDGQIALTEGLHQQQVQLINLSSYNYLGLSSRPEVVAAAKAALDRYGLGAAGSPILSGTMDVHVELEEAIARFKGTEAAMVFPTGYSTNVGMISGLMRPGDWVIADQNAHASIVDGAILSKAEVRFFRHNSPEQLERRLKQAAGRRTLVAIEGVYSMDGDVCRLPELVAVAKRYGARILLDEAHSAFVYGANGRGVAELYGLEDEVDISIGTFSKALGGQGGYVAGSRALYNYLKGFARSRVFSCALAPVVAAGVLRSLELAQAEPELRDRLWANVSHMRARLEEAGVDVGESTSQIIPIMVRNDRRVFEICHKLLREGVYLQPVIYPAVAKHRSRFRVSISAAHTIDQLDQGASILVHVLREEGILL
jgi:glycine C-acetyltransferase